MHHFALLYLMLGNLLQNGLCFWWPKTTTEAPTTILKQIPLTYFRTYTYQPMAGNPFSFPFFGFGASQTPLLGGSRFDAYTNSYPAAANFAAAAPPVLEAPKSLALMVHSQKAAVSKARPSASITKAMTITSTTTPAAPPPPPPPPPPTTTTTTTSSSTTTTTTTTTTPPPPSAPSALATRNTADSLMSPLNLADYSQHHHHDHHGEYPTYNRRIFTSYYARPQYPYPDYYNYQPALPQSYSSLTGDTKSGSRIQFVPCMCPLNMALSSNSLHGSLDVNILGAGGSMQARTNVDNLPADAVDAIDTSEKAADLDLPFVDSAQASNDAATKSKLTIEMLPKTSQLQTVQSSLESLESLGEELHGNEMPSESSVVAAAAAVNNVL